METLFGGSNLNAHAWSPTRLEGMETQRSGFGILCPLGTSPTRLEGMETQARPFPFKKVQQVSDPP